MKSRLLASLLSVSMLFSSIPVNAAELGAGTIFESTETSVQEDEGTNASEETISSEEDSAQDDTASDDESSDTDGDDAVAGDNTEDEDFSNTGDEGNSDASDKENADTPDAGDDNSGEVDGEEDADSEDSEADEEAESKEQVDGEVIVDEEPIEELDINTTAVELQYGENNGLILPGYIDDSGYVYNWFYFTAPEAGYYNFHATDESGVYSFIMGLYDSYNGKRIRELDGYDNLHTNYMNTGDTIYVSAYSYSYDDETINVDVQKITAYNNAVTKDDGSYVFDTNDYTLSILARAGFTSCYVTASLEAKDGIQLGNSYQLLAYSENPANVWDSSYSNIYLYKSQNYKNSYSVYAEEGRTYNLHFVLLDSDENILGIFDSGIEFTTVTSDESVLISRTEVTESSITFDLESKNYGYCYYAPTTTNESTQEKSQYINRGWGTYSFRGLLPDTEYYFQFTNYDGTVFFETKEKTEPTSTQAVYNAELVSANEQLKLSAEVSGYKGSASYAYLYYEYTDALGIEHSDYRSLSLNGNNVETDENNAKRFTVTDSIYLSNVPFEAGQSYDFDLWVEFSNYSGSNDYDLILPKTKETVDIPQSEFDESKLTFEANFNSDISTTVDYSIAIEDLQNNVSGCLYYRPTNSKESYSTRNVTLYSLSPSITGNISNLQLGIEYDFVLFIGGVKKEITLQPVSTPNIALTKESEAINAFDILRTYRVSSTGEDGLADSYTLKLYYLQGNYYSQLGNAATFNAENQYQTEVKTASNSSSRLAPDTDYDLKWELYNSTNTSTGNAIYTFYETIHTEKAEIKLESTENTISTQKYSVTLESDISNFTDFGYFYLYGFIKKEGSNIYRQSNNNSIYLSSGNNYNNTISLSGLESETTYELSLRNSNSLDGVEYANVTFTTPKDERAISATVTPSLHSATVNYTITGVTPSMSGYVHLFIKEDGQDAWERVDYNSINSSYTSFYIYRYNNAELKDGTRYDYRIGFSDLYNASISNLEKYIEDYFTTSTDDRTLSSVGVSSSYTTADVSAVFNGNTNGIYSYIHLFYKKQDSVNWISSGYPTSTSQSSYNYSKTITGLTSDTTYDYALVISDNYDCNSPDEVTKDIRKAIGEFTTRKCDYELSFAVDESKLTNDTAVITVTATGSTEDDRLKVDLRLNDGSQQSVTLKSSAGYKNEVTFTGLLGETKYTITNASISITENNSSIKVGEFTPDFEFITKKAEIPTSITLSSDSIALNAMYGGYYYEGFSGYTLKATASPATATADFVWTSSKPNVATVNSNGRVIAQSAGTTIITVASAYDSSIKAECEVVVKDYVIVRKIGTELQILDEYSKGYGLYKNSYIDGVALYERESNDDGTSKLTQLSEFDVTNINPDIASWKAEGDGENGTKVQNVLYTNNVGSANFVFEKDGIKANLYIYVSAEGKGFGITGFNVSSYYGDYPAVKEKDGSYTIAYTEGISYTAKVEISPKQYGYDNTAFNWSIPASDADIATVNAYGVVTPKGNGDVTLTITPNTRYTINGREYLANESTEVKLHIKQLPAHNSESLYVLANTSSKISDVSFPESWGSGWSWKYPNTPLVTNGVYTDNVYQFEAVYSGTEFYPCETANLSVYIGRITGASVSDSTAATHNQVVEVGGEDKLTLRVSPLTQGRVISSAYVVDIPDNVNGLKVTKNDNGTFDITANKKGSYTLKPVIKTSDEKTVLATTTYKIKAVEGKQVASITITTDTEGVNISGNSIIFETEEAKKDFTLKAEVKDRNGEDIATALTWSVTDKSVATVAATSKTDTHSANVTAKGSGHTVITAVAKDPTGIKAIRNLEIQDHTPRVDTAKANVNIAYDYDDGNGRTYANNAGGSVEIVPVYGETITAAELHEQNSETLSSNLKLISYSGYKYLVAPASDELKTGTYNCTIYVKTNVSTDYYKFPLKVTVINKKPSVTAKMGDVPNLFFKNTKGTVNIKVSGGSVNSSSVTWEDASSDVNNGFAISYYGYNSKKKTYLLNITQQQNLKLTNGKLADPNVAKGTLTVKLYGYKDSYKFENFAIKYNYKKPVLATNNANTNIIPSLGVNKAVMNIVDKTNKRNIYYTSDNSSKSENWYDEITCDSDEVIITPRQNYSGPSYIYKGTAKTKKVNLTLDSLGWREPLKVQFTVKTTNPKAYLYYGQRTFNTKLKTTTYDYIRIKNSSSVAFGDIKYTDIKIKGSNAKAQKLLDDDLFIISTYYEDEYSDTVICIEQSEAAFMNASIPAGTYSYKVTPYYTNPETGESKALNTVTLKLKVINKDVIAKVSPKGNIDLTYAVNYSPNGIEAKNKVVLTDPKFSNLASEYNISSARLVGEYSKYFTLARNSYITYGKKYSTHSYIYINNNYDVTKLKAGQTYKLAIEYTISNDEGESFKVTSNTFNVKIKQSAPKVTVTNNNQTLYAGATDNNLYRTYNISLPSSYYSVESASGSLDCNKDGNPDITVSGSGTSLTVRLTSSGKDAVVATANGKSYNVPVTLKLRGRDGVAKEANVTIKVKVKR